MRPVTKGKWIIPGIVLLVLFGLLLASCAGTSKGTVEGTVTNSLNDAPIAGATVTTDPAIEDLSIETQDDGTYSASLPVGTFTITIQKDGFESYTQTLLVVGGETAAVDAVLNPESPVFVNAGDAQTASAGDTVTLTAAASPLDGSSVTAYQWTQVAGATAAIQDPGTDTTTVILADEGAYKDYLFEKLVTHDRFMVQGINPHSLEEAELATFKVTVTTSSGTYSGTVDVTAHLPWVVSTGIGNVPVNVSVLVHGKSQDSYNWTITPPSGSNAALDDSSGQNPGFTPDAAGEYKLTEANSGASIAVYAGTWAGVITGQDANGEPLAANCTACHNDTIAPDKFTPWAASGHAEILAQNLNTSTHYGESCFPCHSVGFDKDADNGGFDNASDYADFLDSGMINRPSPNNWTNMLAGFPDSALLANIQCENCHGPNDGSTLHLNGTMDPERVDISSDVCGACHGEPARHGRFQQWEESGHANFELAIEEATIESRGDTAAHCGRCHSGQGFLAWIEKGDLTKWVEVDNMRALGLTVDAVQPQTCVVCHDPHAQGKTSGEPNTATVRFDGDTLMLPAGFKAIGVGRGALCITCHNTRNGAHNDSVVGTLDDRAPHVAAQGDVLMGQNAYFVSVGSRSPHSFIEDTCTNCHMQLTPPPAELSYNLSGTNHTFEASLEICSNCHGAFKGGSLQAAIEGELEDLKTAIEQAIIKEIDAQIRAGKTVTLKGMGPDGTNVDITEEGAVTHVELLESHGRSAMDITVDGTTYEHVRLASDTAVGTTTLLSSNRGQLIAKAAWNYFLIHGDGSEGVHNPSFTMDVLSATMAALK